MRKLILSLTLATLAAITMQAALIPVAPAPLHPGDTIAIISPSSTPKDGVAEAGANVLKQ